MVVSCVFIITLLLCGARYAAGASKNKPHDHQGLLEPYSGKPLPVKLTSDQLVKLENGEAVTYNERDGKSGFGVVIQDIDATQSVCFGRIRDLKNYNKMVPHVKGVDIYEEKTFPNGTTNTGAKFSVGLMGLNIGYFLKLVHEPKYNTLTWTLDYRYNSDFDDNVGHWQVMPHPAKKDWTRVLYSCKIKLFPWVPGFAINFLTTKALTEATGWVKREAELEQKKMRASSSSTEARDNTTAKNGGATLAGWFKGLKGGSTTSANLVVAVEDKPPATTRRVGTALTPFGFGLNKFKGC